MPKSLLLAFALAALVACDGEKPAEQPKTPEPPPKAELNVYIWTNYHSEEAIKKFEEKFNAKVTFDLYDNNEVIEQKLQSGAAYDIVVPSDYMIVSLTKQGLLTELDESKLPNLSNIDPMLDWQKKDPSVKRTSVPYLWGTTAFAYRTDKGFPAPDSWAVFFDPKFKGHINMLDDMREVFGAALRVDGKSVNTTDEAAMLAAKKRLIKQKPLVLSYDSSDFTGKIQSGDAWLSHGYSGELARAARESNGTIVYVVPKEGASLYIDSMVIPKSAKHTDLAYEFINFMLDPDIAAETTNATGYATANANAKAKIKPELANDPAVFPSADIVARCETIQDLGEMTPKWDEAWTEIKASE